MALLTFEGFPQGQDLWWLRWFDYAGSGGGVTGSAMIRCVFSKLGRHAREDRLPFLDAALARANGEHGAARLQAGWLPLLRIGLVVRTGKVIGQLGAETRRFTFSARTHGEHLEHLIAQPKAVADPLRQALPVGQLPLGSMPGLLGVLSYPVWKVEDGRLLSIRSSTPGAEHLVMPCPEVFRAAYAPCRPLALALLAGTWDKRAKDVLDLEETRVADDGIHDPGWRVATVNGLGKEHAVVAANLWLGVAGRAAANRLWSAIRPSSGGPGVISAALPFRWSDMEIGVACIELLPRPGSSEPYWFGFEITSIRWPDSPNGPPSVIEWLPGYTPRKAGTDGGKLPGIPVNVTVPDDDVSTFEATNNVDPSAGSGAVNVDGDGPAWMNSPEVVTLEREASGSPDRRRRHVTFSATSKLSAGAEARGGTGAATAQARAVHGFGGGGSRCDRFEQVVDMLDSLQEKNSILSHGEVAPPREWASPRGSRSAWAFPAVPVVTGRGVEKWFMRDFAAAKPGGSDVRRTAMVRSVVTSDGLLYLVEIEPRAGRERYRSMLFEHVGGGRLETSVLRLLGAVASARGVWKKAFRSMAASGDTAGIGRVAGWRHHVLADDGARDPLRRRLNGGLVLDAIRSLVTFEEYDSAVAAVGEEH